MVDTSLSTTDKTGEAQFDRESVAAVEGLIQRLSEQMDQLIQKQRSLGVMLKSIFDNDEAIGQAQTVVQEASQSLKGRQGELNDTQEVKDLKMKLVEVKDDIKMVSEALDTHLLNYYEMTKTLSFPTVDGNEREYTLKAKLKPKKK